MVVLKIMIYAIRDCDDVGVSNNRKERKNNRHDGFKKMYVMFICLCDWQTHESDSHYDHQDYNQLPVIVMIKDEGNGDPAKPQSQGGEGEQPDVAHLKQTTVKGQTDKQKMSSLQQTTFF